MTSENLQKTVSSQPIRNSVPLIVQFKQKIMAKEASVPSDISRVLTVNVKIINNLCTKLVAKR